MIVDPVLRALRDDDGPQRDAQDALWRASDGWRASPAAAPALAALDAHAAGAPLADCPALAALFAPGGTAARAFAGSLVERLCAALAEAPLGQVTLRHFTDGTRSTLLLAQSGNVTLSLAATDGTGLAARPAPASAAFFPNETHEAVLAGTAEADLVTATPDGERRARLAVESVTLSPGDVLARDGERQALLLRRVSGVLVVLRLQRRAAGAGAVREHALADGALVHQSAGNPQDSRIELMLAVAGRMRRKDAAPHAARIAMAGGTEALRWQALRECLALDTATGFAALSAIALRADDPLAVPAGALRARLVEAHPQLAGVLPCPA